MQISWKGQACFHITAAKGKQEQVKIVLDPYEDSIGLSLPSLEADIVLVSHAHPDHSNVKGVKGSPFVIENPGEYEVQGVFVQGIPSFHDDVQGKERGTNTIYALEAEGIRICHLGDLGQKELTAEQIDRIGNVDVLCVPVGGVYTIDGKEAQKIVTQLEPKIIIPMHYGLPRLKVTLNDVAEFLHAMGQKQLEPQPKLVLKEKDIMGEREEAQVVVLQP